MDDSILGAMDTVVNTLAEWHYDFATIASSPVQYDGKQIPFPEADA